MYLYFGDLRCSWTCMSQVKTILATLSVSQSTLKMRETLVRTDSSGAERQIT